MKLTRSQLDEIRLMQINICNVAAQCNRYNLDSKYAMGQIDSVFSDVKERLAKLGIDFGNLDDTDLANLGCYFHSYTTHGMWLIPLYLFIILPAGTVIYTFNSKAKIVGKDDLDYDSRAGYAAYCFRAV